MSKKAEVRSSQQILVALTQELQALGVEKAKWTHSNETEKNHNAFRLLARMHDIERRAVIGLLALAQSQAEQISNLECRVNALEKYA